VPTSANSITVSCQIPATVVCCLGQSLSVGTRARSANDMRHAAAPAIHAHTARVPHHPHCAHAHASSGHRHRKQSGPSQRWRLTGSPNLFSTQSSRSNVPKFGRLNQVALSSVSLDCLNPIRFRITTTTSGPCNRQLVNHRGLRELPPARLIVSPCKIGAAAGLPPSAQGAFQGTLHARPCMHRQITLSECRPIPLPAVRKERGPPNMDEPPSTTAQWNPTGRSGATQDS